MSDVSMQKMASPPVVQTAVPTPVPERVHAVPGAPQATAPRGSTGQQGSLTHVRVHVDRLQVGGLAPHDRQRFVRALERELRDVALNSGTPSGDSGRAIRIPQVSAGRLRPNATPEDAAAQVARQIAQQMRPHTAAQPNTWEAKDA